MAESTLETSISSVTYEELDDLEADFEDFDVELLRIQAKKERALYDRRAQLLRRIPHFWPLVLEQAPPEIDQYVQPLDSNVLLSALEDVEVTRFETLTDGAAEAAASKEGETTGDPRSLAFRFTFAPNDVFEDRVLEKRFWHRTAPLSSPSLPASSAAATAAAAATANAEQPGRVPARGPAWSGLVSEPVAIRWKKGKDPTDGLLDLAVKVWKSSSNSNGSNGSSGSADSDVDVSPETKLLQDALRTKLDKTAMGGVSFFAWFGYVGRRVSASESRAAVTEQRAARAARQAERAAKSGNGDGEADEDEKDEADDNDDDDDDDDDDEDEDEDDEDDGYPFEIFPDGDTLAVTLAEDLWPNAIKYFKQAQELDAMSDDDFESGSENGDDDQPPPKKQKQKQ